jgi:hypothetical protein
MDDVKTLFKIGAISVGLVLASTAVEAKGCIKGAIVGGLGGHYVGRGMSSLGEDRAGRWPTILGAATGCLVGRYEANRRARAAAHPAHPPPSRSAHTAATRLPQPPSLGSAQALRPRPVQSGR